MVTTEGRGRQAKSSLRGGGGEGTTGAGSRGWRKRTDRTHSGKAAVLHEGTRGGGEASECNPRGPPTTPLPEPAGQLLPASRPHLGPGRDLARAAPAGLGPWGAEGEASPERGDTEVALQAAARWTRASRGDAPSPGTRGWQAAQAIRRRCCPLGRRDPAVCYFRVVHLAHWKPRPG